MFFKLKDAVTAGNAVCGIASVIAVVEGHLYVAALFILVSWIFDSLDGVVARLMRSHNAFGGEFDTVCDFLTYGICPGFYVYGVYRPWLAHVWPDGGLWPVLLAGALGTVLPLAACIRQAWRTVKPIHVPGFWIGVPRPLSAFVTVSFFQSAIASALGPWGYVAGIALILALAVGNVGAFPFLSHHGHVWKWWVTPLLVWVFTTLGLALVLGPLLDLAGHALIPREAFFDLVFFYLFGYWLLQWYAIPRDEWHRAREAIARWRAQPEP